MNAIVQADSKAVTLWRPQRNNVYCMDALYLLRCMPDASVDMVLCDLPYGTTQAKWDSVIDLDAMWLELKRVIKPSCAIVLTGVQPFSSQLIMSNPEWYRYQWIWEKTRKTNFLNAKKMPMLAHEDILVFGDGLPRYYPQMRIGKKHKSGGRVHGGTDVYGSFNDDYYEERTTYYPSTVLQFPHDPELTITKSQRPNKLKRHATQKPVKLFEYLVRTYTNQGDLVIDMTAGAGTTAVACRNTGRDYICSELQQEWVDITHQRLSRRFQYDLFYALEQAG